VIVFSFKPRLPHNVSAYAQKASEITGCRAFHRITGNQIAKISQTKPQAYLNTEVCFVFLSDVTSVNHCIHNTENQVNSQPLHTFYVLADVDSAYKKADIALHGNPISELRDVTCHMGSHSVTCHPTQVNVPRLTPDMQAGTQCTYLGGIEG